MLHILMPTFFQYLKNSQVDFIPEASDCRVLSIMGLYPSVTPSHLHTFSSSHLITFTFAHLHICSSSHLLIFRSSHLHMCSSSDLLSHLLILTFAHLHTCWPSRLFIFRSSLTHAHFHTRSFLHLLTFTSVHLEIFSHIFSSSLHMSSSSHLLIFTSAQLHICSSHICSSSNILSDLHIFISDLLHIFFYICLLLFTPSLTPSFSSSHLLCFLSLFSLTPFYLSFFRPRVVPAGSHETRTLSQEPFRTKWGSIGKN